MKIGDKVVAILGVDNEKKIIYTLGGGTYMGEEIPPPEIDCGALKGLPSPKIFLGCQEVVWGFECWWGEPEEMKKMINGLKLAGYKTHWRYMRKVRKELMSKEKKKF